MSYQTIDSRKWHDLYEEATPLDRDMTDECFEAVTDTLKGWGFKGSTTDLAEEVVASIYRYISKSRDEQSRVKTQIECPYCPFGNIGITSRCSHCGRLDKPQEAA